MAPSVAFVVPALNEQENLEAAIEDITRALGTPAPAHRIYIFNDGSTDATGRVADGLAAKNKAVTVVHNERNMGLGYNYFRGVELAGEDYVMMVPGDAEIPEPAIRPILRELGRADLVIPYMPDSAARPLSRRLVSSAFTQFINVLFGQRIKYYNGPVLLRRDLVKGVGIRTQGFAYMAAILVTLLKAGHSYVEVAIPLQYRRSGNSKAVTLKNITSVLRTIGELVRDVYFKR